MTPDRPSEISLVVRDLRVTYVSDGERTRAVRRFDFELRSGETLGIVGESGSGKSTVALALLGLLPDNAKVSGEVRLNDINLVGLSEREMRRIRGRRLGMIFQDPTAALNPVFSIGSHIVDTLRRYEPELSRRDAWHRAGEMIEELGMPASWLRSYPHQLSGGMRQRALIAAAMAADPALLVADEPTSDLDTVSQKQIIRLLVDLQQQRDLGLVLISHDFGVVAALCTRIVVMYLGFVVEAGPTEQVLREPQHPYTQALVQVSRFEQNPDGRLIAPAPRGQSPSDGGCPFYDRCSLRLPACETTVPELVQVGDDHVARCLLHYP